MTRWARPPGGSGWPSGSPLGVAVGFAPAALQHDGAEVQQGGLLEDVGDALLVDPGHRHDDGRGRPVPCVVTSASATPSPSTRWRMMLTACEICWSVISPSVAARGLRVTWVPPRRSRPSWGVCCCPGQKAQMPSATITTPSSEQRPARPDRAGVCHWSISSSVPRRAAGCGRRSSPRWVSRRRRGPDPGAPSADVRHGARRPVGGVRFPAAGRVEEPEHRLRHDRRDHARGDLDLDLAVVHRRARWRPSRRRAGPVDPARGRAPPPPARAGACGPGSPPGTRSRPRAGRAAAAGTAGHPRGSAFRRSSRTGGPEPATHRS